MDASSSERLLQNIERLVDIGTALSAESDFSRLLETILLGAKELTGADGGSLYILTGRTLSFELIHTSSLGIHMGGSSGKPITFPTIALDFPDGTPNRTMIVTRAVHENRLINIPDAYQNADFDFAGTRAFDQKTGYHSQSFLATPLQDHEGRIIGVLQLINAIHPENGEIVPFSRADERLIASLASQAAIAMNRKRLIDGLEELLQSLVRLIATAIDDKSPHTAGHCRRVPAITMALARVVNETASGVFGDVRFSEQELKELEMAAWLHDCGKITTPEYIVDKQTKLETVFDRIHLVDARIEVLRRDAEIDCLLACHGEPATGHPAVLQRDERLRQLDEIQAFLHRCNSGGEFLPEKDRQRIEELAGITTRPTPSTPERDAEPLLDRDEVYNLSIPKGTLTAEERQAINSHIDATVHMLEALPFPEHLRAIPGIAGGHHERMDGKGYPRGIPAGQLPLQARILAIADIFEALTASDRGYRRPNTLAEALTIMAKMCREGHIDRDLYALFLQNQAYLDYAQSYLRPEQVDQVDLQALQQILA